jgi:phosphoglucosamine mutase
MTRYFGTDGVRGIANTELTCEAAFALGRAAVELLGPRLVLGRDTRRSGPMLEAALVAGITSMGGDALLAGIIPTPAVAFLVRELASSGGIVISASHNPPEYNGIKFFDAEGFKLSKRLEDEFEARLQSCFAEKSEHVAPPATPPLPAAAPQPATPPLPAAAAATPPSPVGSAVGTAIPIDSAAERFVSRAADGMRRQGFDLKGLCVAVDCGHGASFFTTPETLRRLGAKVEAINTDFNGSDINVDCGSTHLDQLKAAVWRVGANIGIAHDGDADRMLAVDAHGNELDGDQIAAICALDLKAQGKLAHNTIVATVLSNLGLSLAMQKHQIEVVQADVGDSNVLAAMREGGFVLGGEQSGHTIFLEHNTTGDGLMAALQLLVAMKRSGKSLAELSRVMTKCPQTLINVRIADKAKADFSAAIEQAIRAAEQRLGSHGRVLVRPSGTEPLIRIMVEATDEQLAHTEAQALAALVKQELGK